MNRKSVKIPAASYERLRLIAARRRMTITALIAELARLAREDAPPAAPEGAIARLDSQRSAIEDREPCAA